MKAVLGAILGVAIAVSPLLAAQEPAPDKEKQKQDEPKKQPPANQHQEPQTPEKPKPKPEKPQQPATPPKQQKPDDKEQQDKQKQKQDKETEKKTKESKQQQGQSGQQNNGTHQSAKVSHGKGQPIPPDKFQSNFGRQHHFRVQHLEDGRRFQYGGYWFELVEVWPADWSYSDDCYIEEDAGDYYVVDLYHPGIRVLVIVVEG